MVASVTPPRRPRVALPADPGRRMAAWSLLMVVAAALTALVAGAVGAFLMGVVFHLEEQELLPEAGPWGTVAGCALLAAMVLPAVAGIVFGVRAWRLGERRAGATGILVNALIAAILVASGIATLVFG